MTWPGVSLIAEAGIVAMMGAAAYWILKGEMEMGTLMAFLVSWGFLFDPLSRINPITQTFVGGVVAGKRVFSILQDIDRRFQRLDVGSLAIYAKATTTLHRMAFKPFAHSENLPRRHDVKRCA